MNRIFIVCLFCAVICSGCFPQRPSDLRANASYHSEFEVESNLQTIIKNIDNKTREECRTPGLPTIFLYEELGEARIEYNYGGHLFMLVDLKRQNNKTNVAIYNDIGWPYSPKATNRMLEAAVKGLPGCCRPPFDRYDAAPCLLKN